MYVVGLAIGLIALPGNPFQQTDRQIPPEIQRALTAKYHIDNNWRYYREYMGGMLRLDFGPSFGAKTNTFGFRVSWATNLSVVVDGCIRDFDEIAEMDLPVFARHGGWAKADRAFDGRLVDLLREVNEAVAA